MHLPIDHLPGVNLCIATPYGRKYAYKLCKFLGNVIIKMNYINIPTSFKVKENFGLSYCSFSYSSIAKKVPSTTRKNYLTLSSRFLVNPKLSVIRTCPPNHGNCMIGGTKRCNEEFLNFLNTATGGINCIAEDFDELPKCTNLDIASNEFVNQLRKIKQNGFWVVQTHNVCDKSIFYQHTIIVLVRLGKNGYADALVIDPTENIHALNNQKGDWMTSQVRQKMEDNFFDRFGVKKVTYGCNSNGLAKPRRLFQQHPDSCNVTVFTHLFWLAAGWTYIPRFSDQMERALFCKIFELGSSNSQPFPTQLYDNTKKRTRLQQTELAQIETKIETFV